LFSCIWLVIHHISFHAWHESSDRELDQTAPSIRFLCSGVISELFMSFSERGIRIILRFDSIKKLSSLKTLVPPPCRFLDTVITGCAEHAHQLNQSD
jgi:hypothetical protein